MCNLNKILTEFLPNSAISSSIKLKGEMRFDSSLV